MNEAMVYQHLLASVVSSQIGRNEFECKRLFCICRLSLLNHHYICYKEIYFVFRKFHYTQSTIRPHTIYDLSFGGFFATRFFPAAWLPVGQDSSLLDFWALSITGYDWIPVV
jgi:hypothetical protein